MPDSLRTTFDAAAARYAAARPTYPDALVHDLEGLARLSPGAELLEIGCGPGTATVPLARRGYAITAVELGAALADEARRNTAGLPVEVITAGFEDWDAGHRQFDLVYAATSWHWIDQPAGYRKAAALLRPGGHLAVWSAGHAFPADFDPFFTEIQRVYVELEQDKPDDTPLADWPPPPPEVNDPGLAAAFTASGLFSDPVVRRYVWALRYTAEQYLALLDTFSGHIAMEPAKRDHLYGEVRRLIGQRTDQRITRHWVAVLTIGQVASRAT